MGSASRRGNDGRSRSARGSAAADGTPSGTASPAAAGSAGCGASGTWPGDLADGAAPAAGSDVDVERVARGDVALSVLVVPVLVSDVDGVPEPLELEPDVELSVLVVLVDDVLPVLVVVLLDVELSALVVVLLDDELPALVVVLLELPLDVAESDVSEGSLPDVSQFGALVGLAVLDAGALDAGALDADDGADSTASEDSDASVCSGHDDGAAAASCSSVVPAVAAPMAAATASNPVDTAIPSPAAYDLADRRTTVRRITPPTVIRPVASPP